MLISELLHNKAAPTSDRIISCEASELVSAAVARISEHRIGAVVVSADDKLVGVFSERDVVTGMHARGAEFLSGTLESVMTTDIIIIGPSHSIDDALAIMRDKKIRHLPVVDGDQLIGLVSMRDLMAQKLEDASSTVEFLKGQVHMISSPLPM